MPRAPHQSPSTALAFEQESELLLGFAVRYLPAINAPSVAERALDDALAARCEELELDWSGTSLKGSVSCQTRSLGLADVADWLDWSVGLVAVRRVVLSPPYADPDALLEHLPDGRDTGAWSQGPIPGWLDVSTADLTTTAAVLLYRDRRLNPSAFLDALGGFRVRGAETVAQPVVALHPAQRRRRASG